MPGNRNPGALAGATGAGLSKFDGFDANDSANDDDDQLDRLRVSFISRACGLPLDRAATVARMAFGEG